MDYVSAGGLTYSISQLCTKTQITMEDQWLSVTCMPSIGVCVCMTYMGIGKSVNLFPNPMHVGYIILDCLSVVALQINW